MDVIPELKALWKNVFGDTDEVIDMFFETYYSPELTAYSVSEGRVVSAAYVLPVGHFAAVSGERVPCAHIYAVGTYPEVRGRGLGASVTLEAKMLAQSAGFKAVVLHPAEEWLYDFYAKHAGFYTSFYVDELQAGKSCPPDTGLSARRVSPEEYRALRETRLIQTPHIDLDIRALGFQDFLCGISNGGLFSITYPGDIAGCAAVELDGDRALVKELLCPDVGNAISALSKVLEAETYSVRIPGNGRTFGMTSVMEGVSDGWMGPVFD